MKKNLQINTPNTLNTGDVNPRVQGDMSENGTVNLITGLAFYLISWIAIIAAGAAALKLLLMRLLNG